MGLIAPWTIHEAEIALWPAWKDGMPFHGPGTGRRNPEPLLQCKVSVSIEETHVPGEPTGYGWSGSSPTVEKSHAITVTFPDGAYADAIGRAATRLATGGFHILVVRFMEAVSLRWTCLRFFHVTPDSDAVADADQRVQRTVRLRSTWMQETTGDLDPPSLAPVLLGEVDWVCGPRTVRALTFDPSSETWRSTAENDAGDGSRFVNWSPLSEDTGADLAFSMYVPRAVGETRPAGALPRYAIEWQNTVFMRVGRHDSTFHHGLSLIGGVALQAMGIAEPLKMVSQDRMLEEPVAVFRFGCRIYATLGHGVLAVPAFAHEAPPLTHDPAFRLAVPGPANPATGHAGLTLLPGGAWLDGILRYG